MGQGYQLTSEERARITEIQDLLIERYVALKQALRQGAEARASEIEYEINDLQRQVEEIKKWAKD